MPFYARKLTAVLSERLPSSWHRARIKFIARYVGSLLKLTTTNGKKLTLAFNLTEKKGEFGRSLSVLINPPKSFVV